MGGLISKALGPILEGVAGQGLYRVSQIYNAASQAAILAFVTSIAKTTIGALVGYISPVNSVIKFIMGNPLNHETFVFVREHWFDVAEFIVDLIEPMKRFTKANGQPDAAQNEFNELDMTDLMNVHAVTSQVQRVILSLTEVFKHKAVDVGKFEMKTILTTDSNSESPETTDIQKRSVSTRPNQKPETWLFINGIAGEYHWTHLAVQKLASRFFNPDDSTSPTPTSNSEIRGIFNRSDGIIWDLIECGGERNKRDDGKGINEFTASSRTAQDLLKKQLTAVLGDGKKTDIVMIAHSQGCLLLRLVLAKLHSSKKAGMKERLKVFTFGNPAFEWEEHAYVKYTEHFANKADFVAKLGVLRDLGDKERIASASDSRYWCKDCVAGTEGHSKQAIFRNEKRKGHLFASQYSLADGDYDCIFGEDGQRSELLTRP